MIRANPYYSSLHFFILSTIFLLGLGIAVYTDFLWVALIPFGILFFYFGWQNWHFIFFLLIFLLPWSTEYNFTSTLGTDLPDEPLMLLTAGLFMLNWIYKPGYLERSVWKHPLMALLLLHFTWIIFSVIFSTDPLISLKYLLAKSWYLLAFVFAPLILFKEKMDPARRIIIPVIDPHGNDDLAGSTLPVGFDICNN